MMRPSLAALLALTLPAVALAEGSDQTDVNTGVKAAPQLLDVIAELGGGRLTRVYADVLASGEQIRFNRGDGTLEVRDPAGSIVKTLTPGTGAASSYTTTQVGVFELHFSQDQDDWDVSVSGTAAGYGRLWSTEWHFDAITFGDGSLVATNCQEEGFSTGCDGRTFASFYTVVGGGSDAHSAVVQMKTEGMAGYIYTIAANDYGAPGANGRSVFEVSGFRVPPQHRVYLLPPEDASYNWIQPSVTAGTVSYDEPLCDQVAEGVASGAFIIDSNVKGTYHVVCDLDNDNVFDFTSDDDLHLIGQIDVDTAFRIEWDGTNNLGDPVGAGVYDCEAWVTVGEFHYVGRDIESVYPGLRLFAVESGLTRVGMKMFWNDEIVHPGRAVAMANGSGSTGGPVGLQSSGSAGILSGTWTSSACVVDPKFKAAAPCAQPNVNARSWGDFNLNPDQCTNTGAGGLPDCTVDTPANDRSKGNVAWLDTYTWVAESQRVPMQITVGSLADTDGEGLLDAEEDCLYDTDYLLPDTDSDGLEDDEEVLASYGIFTDPNNPDTDGDTVSDGDETPDPNDPQNTDGDSLIDALDVDDDNDDVPTIDEDYSDGAGGGPDGDPMNDNTDGDLLPDYLDPDDDNDNVDTVDEDPNGNNDPTDDNTDGDDLPNYLDPNDDGDLLDTIDEDPDGDGDPSNDDTDDNGVPNYLDPDDDGDGILTDDEDYDPLLGFGNPGDGDPNNDDWDNDDIPDYLDADDDNDGIPSEVEGSGDTDDDGIPDHHDLDSDGDGLTDQSEGENDTDGDGLPDFQDNDDDGDGIPTIVEVPEGDTDGDEIPDYLDPDDDNDTVPTKDEDYSDGAGGPADGDASNDDTDGDGTPNYQDTDDDNDTILTATEAEDSRDIEDDDVDDDGNQNWVDIDADGDGEGREDTMGDEAEGTGDFDQDGIPDYLDPDGAYSTYYQGSCVASTTGGAPTGLAWLSLAGLAAVLRRKRAGARASLGTIALVALALGLVVPQAAIAGDAPEISRSQGSKGQFVVLWPRVIVGEQAGDTSAFAAALQQRLQAIAEETLSGKQANLRPEPERVCPQAGCKTLNIGSVLVAQHGGCAAIATVSAPGKSRAKLVPFAGEIELKSLTVDFRSPPESEVTVRDMVPCADLLGSELPDAEGAVQTALSQAQQ